MNDEIFSTTLQVSSAMLLDLSRIKSEFWCEKKRKGKKMLLLLSVINMNRYRAEHTKQ